MTPTNVYNNNESPEQQKGEQSKKSEADYLKQYLADTDTNKVTNTGKPSMVFNDKPKEASRTTDLQYFAFDCNLLPLGQLYPNGVVMMVRAAQVVEIQAFSTLDDTNYFDMIEKMNEMLSSCVRVKYPNGEMKPFTHVLDGDRLWLILLIRELTFQAGNSLSVTKTCSCSNELHIELKRDNFVYHKTDPEILPYFDAQKKKFVFKTINDKVFEIAPPSIGLQKSFTAFIIKEFNDKKTPKMSFLKILPFLMSDKYDASYEEIKAKLVEFEKMDDVSFQFVNAAVDKMKFGISELKKQCTCGLEVRTEMIFPGGSSALFVVHDAFSKYIKK